MKCYLCTEDKKLERSHVIPKAYFRDLKKSSNSGQLMKVVTGDNEKFGLSNADPVEELMCRDCEQYLNDSYERSGISVLRGYKKSKRKGNEIEFYDVDFKSFYLYLISILWRVSVSSLSRYKNINLGNDLNEHIRLCLKNNTLKLDDSFQLNHLFKVSVIRIEDTTGQLDDAVVKKIFVDFNVSVGADKDGIVFYFMAGGFLITFYISGAGNVEVIRNEKIYGQLLKKKKMIVPVADISDFKELAEGFSSMTRQAVNDKNNPNG